MNCENCTRLLELLKYKELEIERQRERADNNGRTMDYLQRQREDFQKEVFKDRDLFNKHIELIAFLERLKSGEFVNLHKTEFGMQWELLK